MVLSMSNPLGALRYLDDRAIPRLRDVAPPPPPPPESTQYLNETPAQTQTHCSAVS